jgi:hypothetical protein
MVREARSPSDQFIRDRNPKVTTFDPLHLIDRMAHLYGGTARAYELAGSN